MYTEEQLQTLIEAARAMVHSDVQDRTYYDRDEGEEYWSCFHMLYIRHRENSRGNPHDKHCPAVRLEAALAPFTTD